MVLPNLDRNQGRTPIRVHLTMSRSPEHSGDYEKAGQQQTTADSWGSHRLLCHRCVLQFAATTDDVSSLAQDQIGYLCNVSELNFTYSLLPPTLFPSADEPPLSSCPAKNEPRCSLGREPEARHNVWYSEPRS
jgi:hypothetical protein